MLEKNLKSNWKLSLAILIGFLVLSRGQFSLEKPPLDLNLTIILVFSYFFLIKIKEKFKNLNENTLYLLLLILIVSFGIRFFLIPHVHRLFTDEHMSLDLAKNILEKGKPRRCFYPDICVRDAKGQPGWPYLISWAFFFFGVENEIAINLSALLGSISPFFIFLISYLYSKREKVALMASFLFTIFPLHIIWSVTASTIVPAVFFTLFSLTSILIYDQGDWEILILSIALLVFLGYVRNEFMVLMAPFLWLIPDWKKLFKKKGFLIFFSMILLSGSLLPFNIIKHFGLYSGSSRTWIGKNEFGAGVFDFEHLANNILYLLKGRNFLVVSLFMTLFLLGVYKSLKDGFEKTTCLFLGLIIISSLLYSYVGFIMIKRLPKYFLLPSIPFFIFLSEGTIYIAEKSPLKILGALLIILMGMIIFNPSYLNKNVENKRYELEKTIEKNYEGCYFITQPPSYLIIFDKIKPIEATYTMHNPEEIENLSKTNCVKYLRIIQTVPIPNNSENISYGKNITHFYKNVSKYFNLEKNASYLGLTKRLLIYNIHPKIQTQD